ncbi:hypothetical protein DPMN_015034 [Dreissena polymorpha]|uniref:Uncharacterized protein n=1 Tax=Dreissena polymorpha TaxID=45954 RepID=A0A9D4N8F4_DREPO|nr:hypothetical protein DPMN_015034 [Dreissena polymorpha]
MKCDFYITYFKLDRNFIGTNLLTKFHEDQTINEASRVFMNKCGRTDDGQRPVTKAHLSNQCDGKTDRRTDRRTDSPITIHFHENWAKNVTSRVEKCPPTGAHVFSKIWTIFELVREINKTNVLTNFHDDWAKIVTSRVFTRFLHSQIWKTAPPTGGHLHEDWASNVTSTVDLVFDPAQPNFKLDRDFIGMKLLTKLTDGRTYDRQIPVTKAHLSNQVS